MIDIINFVLLIVLLTVASRLVYWTYKRIQLLIRLYKLKKECGATVKFVRFPLLPTAFISEKPDLIVELGNTVYLIRLYSGGKFKFVHFASPKYSVRFSRMKVGIFAVNRRLRASIATPSSATYNAQMRVFIIPELVVPESIKNAYPKKNVERVMLFNPAPTEVSYVTEEKTTIKVAFTGDEFYGTRIFTASSFVAYADRKTRENDEMIYF